MKIRIKGFKSLIKAVQNRAHLFPVKVLVNGKNKTFYSIRYKSGNKAMEMAKKDMKIPANAEAIFDTKDGKKKGLSEKDVLNLYEKAGKKGSLQDFIVANFKRPKVKEDGQMNINDFMNQVDETNENKGNAKTEKLWQEFEKWRVKAGNDLGGLVLNYNKKVEDMTPSDYRRMMNSFFKEEIARGHTQSGETVDECLESYIQLFKDQIKDKEDRKNAWNEEYYKEIYNHLDEMHKKGSWLFEYDAKDYLRKFSRDKVGLDRYAAQNAGKAALKDILAKNGGDKKEEKKEEPESGITITGPIYDDDERPTYYINDNGHVIETQDPKVVDQYRARQKESLKETNNEVDIDALAEQNKALEEKRERQREKEGSSEHILETLLNTKDEDLNAKIRFGTKKIDSKKEYAEVKDINELANKVEKLKDFHQDIKGRAIMDMLGMDIPLYSKRNGRPFSLGGGNYAAGYCERNYDSGNIEIGLMAETGNSTYETTIAIHECMHGKIGLIPDNVFFELSKGGLVTGQKSTFIEEAIVEVAAQGMANKIHGNSTDREIMCYNKNIVGVFSKILGMKEFADVRKKGLHGIGQKICQQLISGNKEFLSNVVKEYDDNTNSLLATKRIKAIENTINDRTDKTDKIIKDTGKSAIGDLVEELKRGTITLEVALNSGEYKEIAAILITKFLEDEDLEAIEQLALSF